MLILLGRSSRPLSTAWIIPVFTGSIDVRDTGSGESEGETVTDAVAATAAAAAAAVEKKFV